MKAKVTAQPQAAIRPLRYGVVVKAAASGAGVYFVKPLLEESN
jgi:hypothetical protein